MVEISNIYGEVFFSATLTYRDELACDRERATVYHGHLKAAVSVLKVQLLPAGTTSEGEPRRYDRSRGDMSQNSHLR